MLSDSRIPLVRFSRPTLSRVHMSLCVTCEDVKPVSDVESFSSGDLKQENRKFLRDIQTAH